VKEDDIKEPEEKKPDEPAAYAKIQAPTQPFSIDWSKTVYLSPDAKEPIPEDFSHDTNFIIGGLIDRTVVKYASLSVANENEIKAMRLPIEEQLGEKIGKVELGIN
jgi:Trm5-related predicted tRNA methylase